jgi:hypothetical protein
MVRVALGVGRTGAVTIAALSVYLFIGTLLLLVRDGLPPS